MLKFIKKFWDGIFAFGGLIGIIYIPADLFGLPEAYPPLTRVLAVLERFTILAAFTAVLVVYIFWMDARPFVRRWRAKIEHTADLPVLARECRELGQAIHSEIRIRNASAPSAFFAVSHDEVKRMEAMDASSAYNRTSIDIYSERFQGKAIRLLQKLGSIGAIVDVSRQATPYHMQELAVFFCAAGEALEDGDIEGLKALAQDISRAAHDEP